MMVSSKMSALMAVVLMIVAATKVAEGQNPPSCASNLVPCYQYLNSTKPPASCCGPLREAVTKDLSCLCNLYQNPGFLAGLGINVSQALKLPGYCGIPGDVSACKAVSPTSSSQPPPAVPGGNDGSGVEKIAVTGLSSLLLLWASFMLC